MTRAASRTLEQHVDIETPEQVVLSYAIAGVGSRAAAALIDTAICVGAMLFLVLLFTGIRAGIPSARIDVTDEWMFAVVIVAQFLIIWGYYVAFEVLHVGSPGTELEFAL